MPDETPRAEPTAFAPTSLHVITAHAPKPVRRIVVPDGPPRTVTYDGHNFEVMFDGRDPGVVVEEPR